MPESTGLSNEWVLVVCERRPGCLAWLVVLVNGARLLFPGWLMMVLGNWLCS